MSADHIDENALVESGARLGEACQVWDWTKVRAGADIGDRTRLGQGVYVDQHVRIGSDCKVQNGVSVYAGVTIGDRVFVGPAATFTNDRVPRADGESWTVSPTIVEDLVSIGANATIVCGVTLGRACMVGAGAVVVDDVPPGALVVGNPARVIDFVDRRRGPPPRRTRPLGGWGDQWGRTMTSPRRRRHEPVRVAVRRRRFHGHQPRPRPRHAQGSRAGGRGRRRP